MRRFLSTLALVVIAVPGCATPVATAIVVGVLASDAMNHSGDNATMYRAPDPDPSRVINAQDCTKPVDYSAGNLLCR